MLWLTALYITCSFYSILKNTLDSGVQRCAYSTIDSPEKSDLIFSCHINSPQTHKNPVQLCNSLLCKGSEHSPSSVMWWGSFFNTSPFLLGKQMHINSPSNFIIWPVTYFEETMQVRCFRCVYIWVETCGAMWNFLNMIECLGNVWKKDVFTVRDNTHSTHNGRLSELKWWALNGLKRMFFVFCQIGF